MGFPRQEYWSGLPFPSPEDIPNLEIELGSPALQADSLPSEPPGLSGLAGSIPPLQTLLWPDVLPFPASLCSWKLTVVFHRFVWIITGAAERNHFPSCCVTHASFPSETRLIWNCTSLHASGQKWLLLNLYVKICNNLSITKRCYRHPGAQRSSHVPQWMCAYQYMCTRLRSHTPAQLSTASCLHSYPPFSSVSTACKYTIAF